MFDRREGSFVLSSLGSAMMTLLLEGVMILSCPPAVAALWPNARGPERACCRSRDEGKDDDQVRANYDIWGASQKGLTGGVTD